MKRRIGIEGGQIQLVGVTQPGVRVDAGHVCARGQNQHHDRRHGSQRKTGSGTFRQERRATAWQQGQRINHFFPAGRKGLCVVEDALQVALQLHPLCFGETGQIFVLDTAEYMWHLFGGNATFVCQFDMNHATVFQGTHAPAQALGLQTVQQTRHGARVELAFARQFGHGRCDSLMDLVQRDPLRKGRTRIAHLQLDALRHGRENATHQIADAFFRPIAFSTIELTHLAQWQKFRVLLDGDIIHA